MSVAAALPAAALALTFLTASCASPRAASRALPSGRTPEPGARSPEPASRPWTGLLVAHLERYPLARAEDIYKFAHQSVFGPAHAIPSRDRARVFLEEEIAALSAAPAEEPLLDALSAGPELARLNLRPFLAAGGDPERLLDAFVATAALVHGDAAAMTRRLGEAVAVLRELGGEAGEAARLEALAGERAAAGYPAIHHTDAYRDAYRPAYRVVRVDLLRLPPPTQPGAGKR